MVVTFLYYRGWQLSSETCRKSVRNDSDGDREEDDPPRKMGFVLMRHRATIIEGVCLKTEMERPCTWRASQ